MESLYSTDSYAIVYTHYTIQVNTMPKLIRSRHLEFLIFSMIMPVILIGMIYFMESHLFVDPDPEKMHRLMLATVGTCLFLWWVLTVATVGQVPGYGRYVLYVLALPIATIIINCFLDNGRILELKAVGVALILTWLGSLVFCAKDWYDVNHQTFQLTRERLR